MKLNRNSSFIFLFYSAAFVVIFKFYTKKIGRIRDFRGEFFEESPIGRFDRLHYIGTLHFTVNIKVHEKKEIYI